MGEQTAKCVIYQMYVKFFEINYTTTEILFKHIPLAWASIKYSS